MNNKNVLCLGELLYRLQAKEENFFNNTSSLVYAYPGGSEANVAVALAETGRSDDLCIICSTTLLNSRNFKHIKS
ncbi:hypothetical protein ACFX5U_21785 [Sphingobacterium sp. SG20118]|uniref:hypothetical protein n=1 Tax=Sphingobacterium sp. SG20118 TaxID=3367156 RepID=UPI0037DFC62A